jgi:hypothetical protein
LVFRETCGKTADFMRAARFRSRGLDGQGASNPDAKSSQEIALLAPDLASILLDYSNELHTLPKSSMPCSNAGSTITAGSILFAWLFRTVLSAPLSNL